VPFDADNIDLSGPWAGDDDGIYYLRQLEDVVWWNGMSDRDGTPSDLGQIWNNVARGEIARDQTISVEWADVPRGEVLGGGTLELKIGPDGTGNIQIVKTSETGSGFGNSIWTPCTPG
jgi:hypothetical protein